jgi:hypothetical protein
VKFDVSFVMTLTKKSMSNKKWHLSWGWFFLFQKAGVKNFASFLFSELEDASNT